MKMKEFEYTPTRPYWNTNSHPEDGEIRHEWFNTHCAMVFYDRELSKEEIEKYQVIPTHELKKMIGKSYDFNMDGCKLKILKVENFFVLTEGFLDGKKVGEYNQNAMEVWKQSRDWNEIKEQ